MFRCRALLWFSLTDLINRGTNYYNVEEMKKIDIRLSNKSFMDRAPQNIVDQEKSNFANLAKDVKKIELTLKGL